MIDEVSIDFPLPEVTNAALVHSKDLAIPFVRNVSEKVTVDRATATTTVQLNRPFESQRFHEHKEYSGLFTINASNHATFSLSL